MKRSEVKRRPLADTVLAALEPEAKTYRVLDGDKLYFRVQPAGAKSWELRYKNAAGKWSWYGVGSYTELSGSAAREAATKVRHLIRDGIDPVLQRRKVDKEELLSRQGMFAHAVEFWFQHKVKQGRAASTLKGMRLVIDNDLLPALGKFPLRAITHADCAKVQEKIEARQAYNTAEKTRVWLRDIFGMAVAKGWCEHNPATEMHRVAAQAPVEKPYPYLLEADIPDFMQALRHSDSRLAVTTAAWMTFYTASRPGMVRMAEWSEINWEDALWSVPGEKMKMRLPHLVPLPTQVLAMLKALYRTTGQGQWVFPGSGSTLPYLSDAAINKCFALMGYKGRMTGHGSRHTFRTLVAEHGWKDDWAERQLAHVKRGDQKTYNQAEYLGPRRLMAQWYADYVDALEVGLSDAQRVQFAKRVTQAHAQPQLEQVKSKRSS